MRHPSRIQIISAASAIITLAIANTAGAAALVLPSAPYSYTTMGSQYTQNFDSLTFTSGATDGNPVSNLPAEFAAARSNAGTTAEKPSLITLNSSSTVYPGGSSKVIRPDATSTDYALGFATTSSIRTIVLAIANNTGQTMDSFNLSFTAELYAVGATAAVNSLAFCYATSATAANDTLSYSALQNVLTAPAGNGSTAQFFDGRDPLIAQSKNLTIENLNLAPGSYLFLRWTHTGTAPAGTTVSDVFAIDDIVFSTEAPAIPEPASVTLLALGGLLTIARWRRNK